MQLILTSAFETQVPSSSKQNQAASPVEIILNLSETELGIVVSLLLGHFTHLPGNSQHPNSDDRVCFLHSQQSWVQRNGVQ